MRKACCLIGINKRYTTQDLAKLSRESDCNKEVFLEEVTSWNLKIK